MIKNEYLNVNEISRLTVQSTRNVRRRIKKIEGEVDKELLYQDKNSNWCIHHLLLNRFKLQRIRSDKYYAMTIDPGSDYTENEIDEILKFVIVQMGDVIVELNYVVEQKKSNNRNHIHFYIKCNNKKKLLQWIKLGFSRVGYRQAGIFDLVGWKDYITKDYTNIKILKN
jgi:hypothetical protein